jgi:hypothetical protein
VGEVYQKFEQVEAVEDRKLRLKLEFMQAYSAWIAAIHAEAPFATREELFVDYCIARDRYLGRWKFV